MIILHCLDCGKSIPRGRKFKQQLREDERWRCPKCNKICNAIDVPDGTIGLPCLYCKSPTNAIDSLFDNRHMAFFCNVLCAGDYDSMLRGEIEKWREIRSKAVKGKQC